MKFDIKNIYTGDVKFTAEIDCKESDSLSIKICLAVKWALKNNIKLGAADLSDADLRRADLSGADLSGACLSGANLSRANLSSAKLRSSRLDGAELRGANLSGADLRHAWLRDVDMRDTNLSDADLRCADLSGANLSGACLTQKEIRYYKHDFWGILLQYKNEIPALRQHIIEGKIDGSSYSETLAGLMETIANIKHSDVDIQQDRSSYIESWFAMIKQGDTPRNNFASQKALEWLDEFNTLMKTKE